MTGEKASTIRSRKSREKWELNPSKGAPAGNANAVVTGAYAKIYGKILTDDELLIAAQIIERKRNGESLLPELLANMIISERRLMESLNRIRNDPGVSEEFELLYEKTLKSVRAEIRRCEDSISTHEISRKKYSLLKQKLTGEFSVNPDTGGIEDSGEDFGSGTVK
jgi:uncharacterized protein YjcR